jgi:hypothetical protein
VSLKHSEFFVAWQDAVGRVFYPVARLRITEEEGAPLFEFCYIRGAKEAQKQNFSAFDAFPEKGDTYVSDELFPFFQNRVMRSNRPDYAGYVTELGLSAETADPLALLARSGGTRATDRLEIYAAPQGDAAAWYFLLRGVRHLPPIVEERIATLTEGEQLFVTRDVQNKHNPGALLLRSEDKINLGYIPDLLVDDLTRFELTPGNPVINVVRVNLPPSPVQHQVLCRLQAPSPQGLKPFTSDRFLPIET